MRWHGLRLKVDADGLRTRMWRLLWEASVAGEDVEEGSGVFAAPDGRDCVTLYFPPAAQLLATSVGARQCPKPQGEGLMLVAGHARAWHVHFEESGAQALEPARWMRAA
ncbi:MAG TPA: hypothetical protein VKD22_05345 [Ramlibacter sp.]|nr:hypothetical protein [Ramlibacter sp.]